MKNIEMKKAGDKLTVVINLTEECGRSKSGKNITIASTEGNVDVGDGVKLGINCYKSPGIL